MTQRYIYWHDGEDRLEKMRLAALHTVRSEPLFSISQFQSVLVKHGIIFPEAIEDAEGFDGERTLAATLAAYDELMENAAICGDSPQNGIVGQED